MTPSSMNTSLSPTSRAKPISWVTTIIVMPSEARSFITASTSPTSSGSSARGRLVEEHHVGVHRQRPGDRHALLLAAGEVRRVGVHLVGQPDLLQVPAGDLDGLGLAAPVHPLLGDGEVAQHGQVREQVERLEHHADPAADLVDVDVRVGDLDALDEDLARRSGSSSRLTQRSSVDLPEPDGPMTQTTWPVVDVEVDALEHLVVAEVLVQARAPRSRARLRSSCGHRSSPGPLRAGLHAPYDDATAAA